MRERDGLSAGSGVETEPIGKHFGGVLTEQWRRLDGGRDALGGRWIRTVPPSAASPLALSPPRSTADVCGPAARIRRPAASAADDAVPTQARDSCFSPKKSGPDHWVPVISREGGKRTRQPYRKPRKAGLPPSTGSRWYASFGDGEPVISPPRFGSR